MVISSLVLYLFLWTQAILGFILLFINLKELFSGSEHRILASAGFIPKLAAF